jgi:hypothetical protein
MTNGEITRSLLTIGFLAWTSALACGPSYIEGKWWANIVLKVSIPIAVLAVVGLGLQAIWVYS